MGKLTRITEKARAVMFKAERGNKNWVLGFILGADRPESHYASCFKGEACFEFLRVGQDR